MHKIALNEWKGAAVFLFFYFITALLVSIVQIVLVRPIVGLQGDHILDLNTIIDYLVSLLLLILASFFAVEFTKSRFIFSNEKKVAGIATLYFALFIVGLYLQGFSRGVSSNYLFFISKSAINVLVFYYFSNKFWTQK